MIGNIHNLVIKVVFQKKEIKKDLLEIKWI